MSFLNTSSHYWVWDIETFPNIFTAAFHNVVSGQRLLFEISDRRNDVHQLLEFVNQERDNNATFIGFNSIGFDYPVLHYIVKVGPSIALSEIYNKAMSIINADYNNRFNFMVYEDDWLVAQIDLFKIHHFDNVSRATSLKTLEINMGMGNVEDLPFDVGLILDNSQKQVLITYNWHDVDATLLFYYYSLPMIKFRQELSIKYNRNFINHNDGKIGKDFFIMKLEQAVEGSCYDTSSGKKVKRQTLYPNGINLNDVFFDHVVLEHPEFRRIESWLRAQTITETKGVFKGLTCNVDGLEYVFGLGGLHASINSSVECSDDEFQLIDVDVASYYPRIPMKTRLKPAHLPDVFCDIYEEVFLERRKYAKGTPENAMLKLALNSVYGDSNSKYSPFFDTAYTMATTINGQLMLCMLVEQIIKIPNATMVQANTDGITVKCPRAYIDHFRDVCKWWESVTQLELEEVFYSRMMIKDVNNYIAEYEDGGVKRKGAYGYGDDLDWNQNFSEQIVAKAAEAALVRGENVEEFIRNHSDITDFLINTKVPRTSNLVGTIDDKDVKLPNVVRYIVTNDGVSLNKVMPAKGPEGQFKRANSLTDEFYQSVLDEIGMGVWDARIHTKNKSVYGATVRTGINAGHTVTICNNLDSINHVDINYDYYISRANKLVIPLL